MISDVEFLTASTTDSMLTNVVETIFVGTFISATFTPSISVSFRSASSNTNGALLANALIRLTKKRYKSSCLYRR